MAAACLWLTTLVLLVSGGHGLCALVGQYSWERREGSLALLNRNKVVWRLIHDSRESKSCFHPLATVDGEVLTGFRPKDHSWHRGLWWSWKFVNGVNYWEEDPETGVSEGVSELVRITVVPGDDFSAKAVLQLSYHPYGGQAVMNELRRIHIGAPDDEGAYAISWDSEFSAIHAVVHLDRTPPPSKGGPSYGGYGGLSLRLPAGLEGWSFRTSEKEWTAASGHGKAARWVDFSGRSSGITILDHPGNPRHPQPWYLSDRPSLAFFSPAVLFDAPIALEPGKPLRFRYRIIIHSKTTTEERIRQWWDEFDDPQPSKDPSQPQPP